MKQLIFAIAVLFSFVANAQSTLNIDSVFLKTGDLLIGKIINSDKYTIVFEQQGSKKTFEIRKSVIERISTNNVVELPDFKNYALKDAGGELVDASGLLFGGMILSILGPTLSTSSLFVDNNSTARLVMIGGGIGLSFIGLICTATGFTKIGNAGKIMQDVKISENARLDVDYYGTSASVRLRF